MFNYFPNSGPRPFLFLFFERNETTGSARSIDGLSTASTFEYQQYRQPQYCEYLEYEQYRRRKYCEYSGARSSTLDHPPALSPNPAS